MDPIGITDRLRDELAPMRFAPPVTHVYLPTAYARVPHERYLRRYGTGPREILEDGRYGPLVPVGDATAMGKAILETLADPPERQVLIDRARHFSVERAFARYRTLLARSANAPPGTSAAR